MDTHSKHRVYKLISPKCRIHTFVDRVSTGSGNGLSPVRRQAITWSNADLLSMWPLGYCWSTKRVTYPLVKLQELFWIWVMRRSIWDWISNRWQWLGKAWWCHQMETFSAWLAIGAGNSPVPGEFPAQRPVTRSFDVFFDPRLNKALSKQSWGWWFETLSCPLWRHCNGFRGARLYSNQNYSH